MIPGVARRLPGARGTYRFHDLDATLRYNRSLTRMQSRLAVRRIELAGPRGSIATGPVLLEGDTRRLQRGLWVGDTHVSVDQVLLTDPPGIDIEASGVDLDITVHADDGLLEQATRLRVDTLTTPGVATRNIHLETLASDLDAASIAALVDEVVADGHLDLPAERLRELIHAGPALELRDLSLVHAAGDMRLTMRLAIAADRAGEVSSAADLLTIAEGRGQLTVDERLVTHMTGQGRSDAGSEGSQALVAMGLLRPDNGRLVADPPAPGLVAQVVRVGDTPLTDGAQRRSLLCTALIAERTPATEHAAAGRVQWRGQIAPDRNVRRPLLERGIRNRNGLYQGAGIGRYITATRLHRWRTTDRSWAMNSSESPSSCWMSVNRLTI